MHEGGHETSHTKGLLTVQVHMVMVYVIQPNMPLYSYNKPKTTTTTKYFNIRMD